MPILRLDFNWSGSFCLFPLGMLTLGTVLFGIQPPCYEAVQVATCRGPHWKESRFPADSSNWTSSQAPSYARCLGIPGISTSAELPVKLSDDYSHPLSLANPIWSRRTTPWKLIHCRFKALSFEVICYTALANWNKTLSSILEQEQNALYLMWDLSRVQDIWYRIK